MRISENPVLTRDPPARGPSLPLSPIRNKSAARLRCYGLLALADTLAITLSFLTVSYLFSLTTGVPFEHGLFMIGATLPIFAIQAASNGAYGAAALDNSTMGAERAARALALSAGVVLLIAYMLKASGGFSRAVFVTGFVVSFVLLILGRRFLKPLLARVLQGSSYNTIVICDAIGYVPQADETVLSTENLGFDPATSDPRAYNRLARTVEYADRLIIACDAARAPAWAPVLRTLAVDSEILTDVRDELGAIGMGWMGSHRTLIINNGPMTLSARALKRAFDIVVSLAATAVLLPMFAAIALAIRLESSGPVFFRQERIGRGNQIFRIFKFRSMYTEASDAQAARLTAIDDARVTRVGAFIRRTSIDELPQLFNVLMGDMSIVGPRPHALAAKAADLLYWDVDARYRERHVIKPGMTGLAQVRGFRGNTHQVADLTNRLQADLEYVSKWSLVRDITIIMQTLKVMRHANAY
jgi:polysaccharide biosynthesis protein PslA